MNSKKISLGLLIVVLFTLLTFVSVGAVSINTLTPTPGWTRQPSSTVDLNTRTPEPTNTPVPTNTPEPTNTPFPTNTPEPTSTFTDVPTETDIPTNTPNSPTNTPNTPDVPTSTATQTEVVFPPPLLTPPVRTFTPTSTPTLTPTSPHTLTLATPEFLPQTGAGDNALQLVLILIGVIGLGAFVLTIHFVRGKI